MTLKGRKQCGRHIWTVRQVKQAEASKPVDFLLYGSEARSVIKKKEKKKMKRANRVNYDCVWDLFGYKLETQCSYKTIIDF